MQHEFHASDLAMELQGRGLQPQERGLHPKEMTDGLVSTVLAEAVSRVVKASLPEPDILGVHLSPTSY